MEEDLMLIDEFSEVCELINVIKTKDGEGGFLTHYEVAGEFQAAIVLQDSSLAQTIAFIAEKEQTISRYVVVTDEEVVLKYPDIIRRKKDNQIFRITSDGTDVKIPASSTIRKRFVNAERWELTND